MLYILPHELLYLDTFIQLSTDALHTATPTVIYSTMHIYVGRWTPSQLSTDSLHTTKTNAISSPSIQLITDALHTTIPTNRSKTMHIYRRKMDLPKSIKHRYIAYHCTHC